MEKLSAELNYVIKEIPEHILNEVTISSTKIRNAILSTDFKTANAYLAYDYFFEGDVVEGNKIGRTIGWPTANIKINDENKLIPGDGIYAVELSIDNQNIGDSTPDTSLMKGMMSIGLRPTIGISDRTIEVNIFDFDKDIYGEKIRVFVKDFLREEKKFSGLDELKNAIANDKIEALKLLSEL